MKRMENITVEKEKKTKMAVRGRKMGEDNQTWQSGQGKDDITCKSKM